MVLFGALPASAQPLQSFRDLGLRVNLDDRLTIEDQSGARIVGRLTRLTRDEITIRAATGEQRLTRAAVRQVGVRRYLQREGVLIGAGAGAALGALAACAGSERTECADGPILAGAVGAGVGLALSRLFPRTATVYRSPVDEAPSRESGSPEGPFDDLALRVNLDDRLRVDEGTGARTTGRLTALTGDEMTLETDAGPRRLTSATVRDVAVRRYSPGRGALFGAGIFTVLAVAAPACRSNPDCSPIAAAAVGAGVGLAVAALIPRMTTVFRMQERRPSFSPQLSRGVRGIRVSLRW